MLKIVSEIWTVCAMVVWLACGQFHQLFTRAFFVQNFAAKNHKAERN